MIITYTQDDGSVEAVSTDDLSAVEAAAIESCTGMEWSDVDAALRSQSPTAMRAVLWAHRKRQAPTLRFSEFDVPKWRRRLKARLEYEEILDLVTALRRDQAGEAEFDTMLQHMRRLAHDVADVDKAVSETGPKAALADGPQRLEESAA